MSQPVKLSDALILDARVVSAVQQRSIAGQVEYWARLGRSVSELLDGRTQLRLVDNRNRASLSKLVETVEGAEGQARLKTYLESRPFPHFAAHPTRKGLLVRTGADGCKIAGRFKNRQFIEVADKKPDRTAARRVPGRAAAARAR